MVSHGSPRPPFTHGSAPGLSFAPRARALLAALLCSGERGGLRHLRSLRRRHLPQDALGKVLPTWLEMVEDHSPTEQ